MLALIVERDGTQCSACHTQVDLTLTWPHRLSKSIDHTVPLSRGGEHSLGNTTLMHLSCNASKGARLVDVDA